MIHKSKNIRVPRWAQMIAVAALCTTAYKLLKTCKKIPVIPKKKPELTHFFRLTSDYATSLSMIRSRLDDMMDESGCTAAAAIYGDNGNKVKYLMTASGYFKNDSGEKEHVPVKMIFPTFKILPVPNIFNSFAVGSFGVEPYDRNIDAEFKLLNVIAEIIDNSKATRSPNLWVMLRVELQPCASCAKVIQEFRNKFPNIEFEVKVGKNGFRKSLKKIARTIISARKTKADYDAFGQVINVSRSFE